jgi:hypothetical protein
MSRQFKGRGTLETGGWRGESGAVPWMTKARYDLKSGRKASWLAKRIQQMGQKALGAAERVNS